MLLPPALHLPPLLPTPQAWASPTTHPSLHSSLSRLLLRILNTPSHFEAANPSSSGFAVSSFVFVPRTQGPCVAGFLGMAGMQGVGAGAAARAEPASPGGDGLGLVGSNKPRSQTGVEGGVREPRRKMGGGPRDFQEVWTLKACDCVWRWSGKSA